MRILVTGSRDWSDALRIGNVLADYHQADELGFDLDEQPTLVSGACPTGADRAAEVAARFMGWQVERHPADWSRGRIAGPDQNPVQPPSHTCPTCGTSWTGDIVRCPTCQDREEDERRESAHDPVPARAESEEADVQ